MSCVGVSLAGCSGPTSKPANRTVAASRVPDFNAGALECVLDPLEGMDDIRSGQIGRA